MRKNITRYTAHYHTFQKKRVRKIHAAAKHPFAVPVFTFLGLFVLTAGLFFYFHHRQPTTINPNVVVISHDHEQQIVSSKEPTVGKLLIKLNIKVNNGDVVEPAPDTPIQQDDFRINIYRAVPVEIVDQGQTSFSLSAQTSERSAALEAGVTIYPEDKLTRKPITDFVATGAITEQVVIDRATPVNVNLYGAPVVMRTHATTVQGLLDERNIKLKPQDQVTPALATPITPGIQISVVRNGLSTVTVQEDIPAPTQTITDNSLAYGTSAVRQQGTPGKRAVTYQVNTQNGVEVGRTPIQTTVVSQPVTQIVVIGTNLSGIKGDMALAGIAPSEYQYADYIISNESGWCPTKWQGEYGGCPAYHGAPTSSYTGYGLCQATPGSKMASAGEDWATNPVTQLKWCTGYARSRYGSWQAAYNHWLSAHNW
jgi:uncharacterized protein YabE (DUF348 family)